MIDGEEVTLDDTGRPDFNLLTHSRSSASRIWYFVFDVLYFENRDTTHLPLFERRELLKSIPLKPPMKKLQLLTIKSCPFVNLPETGRSRWGENLTAEKMKQCVWVKPELTARIEFLERTEGGRLRHSRFVRLNN